MEPRPGLEPGTCRFLRAYRGAGSKGLFPHLPSQSSTVFGSNCSQDVRNRAMTTATHEFASHPPPGQNQPRGRVCSRAGCGQSIVGSDGRPRYDRNFCGEECRRADKRERMQEKRRKARIGRCPTCGKQTVEGKLRNGAVPFHDASPVVETPMTRDEGQEGQVVSANRL